MIWSVDATSIEWNGADTGYQVRNSSAHISRLPDSTAQRAITTVARAAGKIHEARFGVGRIFSNWDFGTLQAGM